MCIRDRMRTDTNTNSAEAATHDARNRCASAPSAPTSIRSTDSGRLLSVNGIVARVLRRQFRCIFRSNPLLRRNSIPRTVATVAGSSRAPCSTFWSRRFAAVCQTSRCRKFRTKTGRQIVRLVMPLGLGSVKRMQHRAYWTQNNVIQRIGENRDLFSVRAKQVTISVRTSCFFMPLNTSPKNEKTLHIVDT